LGAYNGNQVYISEISPSRSEIKIKPKNIDIDLNTDWLYFNSITERIFKFVANFGDGNIIPISNYIYNSSNDLGEYILKLYTPLPNNYSEKQQLWISKLVADRIIEDVNIERAQNDEENYNLLKGPNFNCKVYSNTIIDTNNYNFDEIQTYKT
jgi:hypothetical protein